MSNAIETTAYIDRDQVDCSAMSPRAQLRRMLEVVKKDVADSIDAGWLEDDEKAEAECCLRTLSNIDFYMSTIGLLEYVFEMDKYELSELICEIVFAAWGSGYYGNTGSEGLLRYLNWQKSSNGGAKSGQSRREKAKCGWMKHAIALATMYRRSDPHISQDNLASEIIAAWRDEINPPGHSRLKQFISQKEKAGELMPRRKKMDNEATSPS